MVLGQEWCKNGLNIYFDLRDMIYYSFAIKIAKNCIFLPQNGCYYGNLLKLAQLTYFKKNCRAHRYNFQVLKFFSSGRYIL